MKYLKIFFYCLLTSTAATAGCLDTQRADGMVTPRLPNLNVLNTADLTASTPKLLGWSNTEVAMVYGGSIYNAPCVAGLSSWVTRPAYLPAAIGTIATSSHSGHNFVYNLYPTEHDNIGYIAHAYGHTTVGHGPINDSTGRWAWGQAHNGIGIRHLVQFVIYGRVAPGTYTLASRQFAQTGASSSSSFLSWLTDGSGNWPIYYAGGTMTVTGSTCEIDPSDQNKAVDMGTVGTRDFHGGVGSTVKEVSFSLKVNCQAGATVQASMSDAINPSNNSEILTLENNSSSATGVGIQIFTDGDPIRFGLATNNHWDIGGSDDALATSYVHPLTAKYIQTATDITGGSVSAKSTVLLSYK